MTDKFPSWYYGPNDQAAIFDSEADVPKGWEDHPTKVKKSAAAPAKIDSKPASGAAGGEAATLDAHGHPYDAALHAGTGSKTQAGLWRMKVGVKRPDPAPGYPLDL